MAKKKKPPTLPFDDVLNEPFTPRMAIAPVCRFCGEDSSAPDHHLTCDGQQGGRDDVPPTPIPPIPPVWIPPVDQTSTAFDGLDPQTLDAIRGAVPRDMVTTLVGYLTDTPRHADDVRRAMAGHPWFPAHAKRDTQLRRIRTIRDAAIAWGFPVCSTNEGYALGTWEQVIATAVRARRFAAGAYTRAAILETLAARLRAEP